MPWHCSCDWCAGPEETMTQRYHRLQVEQDATLRNAQKWTRIITRHEQAGRAEDAESARESLAQAEREIDNLSIRLESLRRYADLEALLGHEQS